MQLDELLAKVSRIPAFRQQEVMDYVEFLEQRSGYQAHEEQGNWSDSQFRAMSIEQAMRGLEEEPELYSEDDLKERWQ